MSGDSNSAYLLLSPVVHYTPNLWFSQWFLHQQQHLLGTCQKYTFSTQSRLLNQKLAGRDSVSSFNKPSRSFGFMLKFESHSVKKSLNKHYKDKFIHVYIEYVTYL